MALPKTLVFAWSSHLRSHLHGAKDMRWLPGLRAENSARETTAIEEQSWAKCNNQAIMAT